ncbi:hypothetical protein ACPCG0_13055 [Propionibacteriaceae bacterium Y1923]
MNFLLHNLSTLVGVAAILAVSLATLRFSWRRLNGTVRAWTVSPPMPTQISGRNTWPFMVFCFSLAMLVVVLVYPVELAGWEQGRRFIWSFLFWVPMAGVVLSFFHWPLVLTPRWYKNWARRPEQPPWSNEEVVHVLRDMPPGKKRDRMIKDMGWADIDVEQAWQDLGIPGRPPQEWWERMHGRVKGEEAAMGITEGMTLEEQLEKRVARMNAQKAARRQSREDSGGR